VFVCVCVCGVCCVCVFVDFCVCVVCVVCVCVCVCVSVWNPTNTDSTVVKMTGFVTVEVFCSLKIFNSFNGSR